jgi:hypothetical protein
MKKLAIIIAIIGLTYLGLAIHIRTTRLISPPCRCTEGPRL